MSFSRRFILFFVTFYSFILFQTLFSVRSRRLHTTSQRLGAVAASTELPAGYKLSNLHCLFRGATAAITPNRPLGAGIFILLCNDIISLFYSTCKDIQIFHTKLVANFLYLPHYRPNLAMKLINWHYLSPFPHE